MGANLNMYQTGLFIETSRVSCWTEGISSLQKPPFCQQDCLAALWSSTFFQKHATISWESYIKAVSFFRHSVDFFWPLSCGSCSPKTPRHLWRWSLSKHSLPSTKALGGDFVGTHTAYGSIGTAQKRFLTFQSLHTSINLRGFWTEPVLLQPSCPSGAEPKKAQ